MPERDISQAPGHMLAGEAEDLHASWVRVTGPDGTTVVAVVSAGALQEADDREPLHHLISQAVADFVLVGSQDDVSRSDVLDSVVASKRSTIIVTSEALEAYGDRWSDSYERHYAWECPDCPYNHEPGRCPFLLEFPLQ